MWKTIQVTTLPTAFKDFWLQKSILKSALAFSHQVQNFLPEQKCTFKRLATIEQTFFLLFGIHAMHIFASPTQKRANVYMRSTKEIKLSAASIKA